MWTWHEVVSVSVLLFPRHLCDVLGHKYEETVHISYIRNHLLWFSESCQTRKSLFCSVSFCDLFCQMFFFFCFFFTFSCIFWKCLSCYRQRPEDEVSCGGPQLRHSFPHSPFRESFSVSLSARLYDTNASHVGSSLACALMTTLPRCAKIPIRDFLCEALLISTVSEISSLVCVLETVVLTCCRCWRTWMKAWELIRVTSQQTYRRESFTRKNHVWVLTLFGPFLPFAS